MTNIVALDVAVLPPPDVSARAIEYSAVLPDAEAHGLRLDAEHLPHLTLTQQFIREEELDGAFDRVNRVLANQPPLRIVITGGWRGGHTLWLAADRSAELVVLHERLMDALFDLEWPDGGAHAFFDGDGRERDVSWVAGFRDKSSFSAFTPHITLGHGKSVPVVEPFAFEAATIAACHLGRFCTCRRVLRSWKLTL